MTLGELINKRRADLGGESYERLSARAARRNYSISRTMIQAYATGGRKIPNDADTFAALAAAIDVPLDEVVLAWLDTMGVRVGPEVAGKEHVRAWVTLTGDRSDEQITHLLRVAQTVAAALDSTTGETSASPGDEASSAGDDHH